MNRKLIVVDSNRCTGCRSCEVACSTWNEGETNPEKARIRILHFRHDRFSYPAVCQQCTEPLCMEKCPTNAIYRDKKSGIVKINQEECVGCKLCLEACPLGAMFFFNGVAAKCELCGGAPKCVEACEWKALTYAEPQEIGMEKRVSIANLARRNNSEKWIDWWEAENVMTIDMKDYKK